MAKNLQSGPMPPPLPPHPLAEDLLLKWMTPYGRQRMDEELLKFPPHIITRKHLVLLNSVSPDTLHKCAAGVIHFTKYCDDIDISEDMRMPAPEILLELFITNRGAYHVGKETMEDWVQGLELWHLINGAPWNGDKGLKLAMKGSAKCAPESGTEPQGPKQDPVTLQHLQALRNKLDLTNSFDSAVFAVACIAFWCCCRLSELVIDTDFDPLHQISRAANIRRGVASNGTRYSSFHLPSTKDKSLKGDDVNISDSTCSCSAYTALLHHLQANSKVPAEAPLFSFETADGGWAPMQRSWFLDRCNEAWGKEGSRKGLSFRMGGTIHQLLLGIDPHIVLLQGRWNSQTFLAYWGKCEENLPLVMGFQLKDYCSVLTTMSVFKARLTGKN